MGQDPASKEMDNQETVRKSIPEFYVNSVELSISLYDIALIFGLGEDKDDSIEQTVMIRMSPQHALALNRLLLDNLEVYEDWAGPIPTLDNIDRNLTEEGDILNENTTENDGNT